MTRILATPLPRLPMPRLPMPRLPAIGALLALVLPVLLAGLAQPARAQTWPEPVDPFVNDLADLVPPDTEARLRDALGALREATGIAATLLTLPSRAPYAQPGDFEAFATGLFNHWGIGDARRDDGILILVVLDERKIRIELGAAYPEGFDRVARRIIDDEFLPNFRNQNYARGIEAGTAAVIRDIARAHAAGKPPPEGKGGVSWPLASLGALLILGVGGAALLRHPRFRRCPSCGRRGCDVQTHVLKAPTRKERGQSERHQTCRHCGHTTIIPVIVPSLSEARSSKSSFGGGTSRGGGASGSW